MIHNDMNPKWLDVYDATVELEKLKKIDKRTENNQRSLSQILRRDPTIENFVKVYSIVESLHIKEGGGEKVFKTDINNNKYIEYICGLMKKKSTVLEIGCSDGDFCNFLEKKGHHVFGIDSAIDCIELAKKKYPNSKFEVAVFDCRNLKDFKSEIFDYVVSNQLIEHIGLSGLTAHLEQIKRLLKKKGKYFIACPNALRSGEEGDLHLKIYYFFELYTIAKMLNFDIQLIWGFKNKYMTLPKLMNPLIIFYEKLVLATRLNFIFNYLNIYSLCIPLNVTLTKIDSNAENITKREKITKFQRIGLYR